MKKFVFFQKWTKSPDMRSARLCVTRKEVISQQAFGAQGHAKFIAREGRKVRNTNHGTGYLCKAFKVRFKQVTTGFPNIIHICQTRREKGASVQNQLS